MPAAAQSRHQLAVLLFVVLLALVNEGFATGEHEIDHALQLVRHGRVDARLVHAGTHWCEQAAFEARAFSDGIFMKQDYNASSNNCSLRSHVMTRTSLASHIRGNYKCFL